MSEITEKIINDVVREWFNNYTNFDKHLKTYGFEKEVIDRFIDETLKKVMEIIDDKIDHYTPYRPITDSLNAQQIRGILEDLKQKLESLK